MKNKFSFFILLLIFFSCSKDQLISDEPFSSESGTFTDERDEQMYKWVKIGEQIWMAENLAYLPNVSPYTNTQYNEAMYYIYDYNGEDLVEAKDLYNYNTYGVFYNWTAALNACPNGWHLPSYEEWDELASFISNEKGPYGVDIPGSKYSDWKNVGKHLKSSGTIEDGNGLWKKTNLNEEGTDDYGFSGLPGGNMFSRSHDDLTDDYFSRIQQEGSWWSTTEESYPMIIITILEYNSIDLSYDDCTRSSSKNVRCIKD